MQIEIGKLGCDIRDDRWFNGSLLIMASLSVMVMRTSILISGGETIDHDVKIGAQDHS